MNTPLSPIRIPILTRLQKVLVIGEAVAPTESTDRTTLAGFKGQRWVAGDGIAQPLQFPVDAPRPQGWLEALRV